MKSIISTRDAESGASSHGGVGQHLPIRSQLDEVTLTLSGELSKSLDSDVGDATPFEGDEKLPNVMGLQLINAKYHRSRRNNRPHTTRVPGLARSVENDNADILACTSWHAEGNIFGIAQPNRVEE